MLKEMLEERLEELKKETKEHDIKKEMIDFSKKLQEPECCMIICDEGEYVIGNTIEIQSLLAKLINGLKEKGMPQEMIEKAVELGLNTELFEKVENGEALEKQEEALKKLEELKELLGIK